MKILKDRLSPSNYKESIKLEPISNLIINFKNKQKETMSDIDLQYKEILKKEIIKRINKTGFESIIFEELKDEKDPFWSQSIVEFFKKIQKEDLEILMFYFTLTQNSMIFNEFTKELCSKEEPTVIYEKYKKMIQYK